MSNVAVMYENAVAQEWERVSAPDPLAGVMEKASHGMREAVERMKKAEDSLADAVNELRDTPLEDQVASLLNQLEELRVDISILAWRFRKGERK